MPLMGIPMSQTLYGGQIKGYGTSYKQQWINKHEDDLQ